MWAGEGREEEEGSRRHRIFFDLPIFRDLQEHPLVPKKFSLAVVLEQNFQDAIAETVIPNRYKFLSEEEFFGADLTFNGNFGNADMEVSDGGKRGRRKEGKEEGGKEGGGRREGGKEGRREGGKEGRRKNGRRKEGTGEGEGGKEERKKKTRSCSSCS
jgi:hypothetical protein